MSTAKVIEIISESPESFEAAIRNGIAKAGDTIRQVRSAWVSEQKVCVENGRITEFRVTLRVTFVLTD